MKKWEHWFVGFLLSWQIFMFIGQFTGFTSLNWSFILVSIVLLSYFWYTYQTVCVRVTYLQKRNKELLHQNGELRIKRVTGDD